MAEQGFEATSLSLLQRAQSDDQSAWSQIVHLYGPLVHRWCKRSGLTDEDTADVFQETFRAVARNLANFKPTRSVGSFRSWLKTIVRTKVADHFRRRGNQPAGRGGTEAHLELSNLVDPLVDDDEPDQSEADSALVVQRAMDLIQPEFSSQNWMAFRLVAIDGQSATDVASQLKVSPQAVRQANYRIRRRLRGVLHGLDET